MTKRTTNEKNFETLHFTMQNKAQDCLSENLSDL